MAWIFWRRNRNRPTVLEIVLAHWDSLGPLCFAASKKSLHGLPFDQSWIFLVQWRTTSISAQFPLPKPPYSELSSRDAPHHLFWLGRGPAEPYFGNDFPSEMFGGFDQPDLEIKPPKRSIQIIQFCPQVAISKKTQTPCLRCKCQCFIWSYHVGCFLSSTMHHFEPRIVPTRSPWCQGQRPMVGQTLVQNFQVKMIDDYTNDLTHMP